MWRESEPSICASTSGSIASTGTFSAGLIAVCVRIVIVAVMFLPCSAISIAAWNSRAVWKRSLAFFAARL